MRVRYRMDLETKINVDDAALYQTADPDGYYHISRESENPNVLERLLESVREQDHTVRNVQFYQREEHPWKRMTL